MRFLSLALAMLLSSGCAGARWVGDLGAKTSHEKLGEHVATAEKEKPAADAQAAPSAETKGETKPNSPAPPAANDPWQQSLARLRERTDLDPQTKARLLADMEQVEPVYRPMMARTLEAILAPPATSAAPKADAPPAPSAQPHLTAADPDKPRRDTTPPRAALAVPPVATTQIRPLDRSYNAAAQPVIPSAMPPAASPTQLASFSANPAAAMAQVAPPTAPAAAPKPKFPWEASAASATPAANATAAASAAAGAANPATSTTADANAGNTTPGAAANSAKPEPPLDYRKELQDAITALQTEIGKLPEKDATRQRLEVEIKLLQLAAGERDAAVKGLDRIDPWLRDYWKHQFHALVVGLDDTGTPVASRRAALALRELREASSCLATGSTLDVRNLAFCTEVNSFGRFSEFQRLEFQPNQELLLYAEIDNVSVAQTSNGFESSLQGSYQILGPTGQRVADYTFPVETDVCRNRRRDYFIPFRLYLPKKIDPGRYTLQLTVEDLKGKKFGQGSIDFSVIAATTAAR